MCRWRAQVHSKTCPVTFLFSSPSYNQLYWTNMMLTERKKKKSKGRHFRQTLKTPVKEEKMCYIICEGF